MNRSANRGKGWARAELNRRSSPCQGDVIAPRPRALVHWLADYLRDPSRTSFLGTGTCDAGSPIAHLEDFSIGNIAVCLALQAEALVARHCNRANHRRPEYEVSACCSSATPSLFLE